MRLIAIVPATALVLATTLSVLVSSASASVSMLCLVNKERAKAGLLPLVIDNSLETAAGEHAADMQRTGVMSHTGSDGRSPFQRMQDAGFPSGTMAENIALGQKSETEVMTAWMNSAGHRENIMGDYNCFGSGQAGTAWVQDFGKRNDIDASKAPICPGESAPAPVTPPTPPMAAKEVQPAPQPPVMSESKPAPTQDPAPIQDPTPTPEPTQDPAPVVMDTQTTTVPAEPQPQPQPEGDQNVIRIVITKFSPEKVVTADGPQDESHDEHHHEGWQGHVKSFFSNNNNNQLTGQSHDAGVEDNTASMNKDTTAAAANQEVPCNSRFFQLLRMRY